MKTVSAKTVSAKTVSTTTPSPPGRSRSARGFSLMELLFASFLILVIAVGILPLFMRAIQNNTAGSSSSQMISHLRSGFESMQFTDLSDLSLDGEIAVQNEPDYLSIPTTTLYSGPIDPVNGGDAYLGDERWVNPDNAAGEGVELWEREVKIFYHPLSDVLPGIVSVGSDTGSATFETTGHPDLFDSPMTVAQGRDSGGGNLIRLELKMSSKRVDADGNKLSGPVSRYQDITVSRVRAY